MPLGTTLLDQQTIWYYQVIGQEIRGMLLSQKTCRCCANKTFTRLEQTVELSPFFRKYGLQIDVDIHTDSGIRSLFLESIEKKWPKFARCPIPRIKRMLGLRPATTLSTTIPYGLCATCNFLAPWPELSNDLLIDYYSYYLSEAYKNARLALEPDYAKIAYLHGSQEEFNLRRVQHTDYLMPILSEYFNKINDQKLRLLDYGGGDGGIQPISNLIESDIYEIGRENLCSENYDVVQCLHVLEHVGHPLETCKNAFNYCRDGGLLYLEVPYEFPGIENVSRGILAGCDEHINKFSPMSVLGLLETLGGKILFVEEGLVEFLHLPEPAPVVRGLIKKVNL